MNELWSRGDRVTCGVISEDTRVSPICQYEPPANPHSTDNSKLDVTLNDNLASADCYSWVMSFNRCQPHAITVKHLYNWRLFLFGAIGSSNINCQNMNQGNTVSNSVKQ